MKHSGIALLVLTSVLSVSAFGGTVSTSTAQSVGVDIKTHGAYTFKNKSTYRFNGTEAATYFNNLLSYGPALSCSGNGCGVCQVPATPNAPPPDATQVVKDNGNGSNDFVGQQRCTFLDGGDLQSKDYQQVVQVTGSCPNPSNSHQTLKFTESYTWSYHVSPNTSPVASYTAWDLVDQTTTGSPVISLNADIAGESLVMSKQFPTGKYSFSLLDGSGLNRVTGVSLTITDSSSNVVLLAPDPNVLGSTLTSTLPVGYSNFDYVGNAGTNGTSPALGCLLNGTSYGILNGSVNLKPSCWDQFAGNNNGGSDGSAAQVQHLDETDWTFPPSGNYTITVAGTVKGNSGTASQSFHANNLINIVTPGCSSN